MPRLDLRSRAEYLCEIRHDLPGMPYQHYWHARVLDRTWAYAMLTETPHLTPQLRKYADDALRNVNA